MISSLSIAIALVIYSFIVRRSREYALALLIFSLPLYVFRFSIGPIPSTLLESMILILFVSWVIDKKGIQGVWAYIIEKVSHGSRRERALHLFLFFFVLSASISVALSPDPRAGLGIWRAYFIEPALFFIVFFDTIKSSEQVRRMITASILSGCALALVAVYQKLTGWNIPTPWVDERRVTSIYPYPNAVGLYLAPIVWLTVGRARELLFEKKIPQAVGAALAAALCVLALVFSKTEAALVALAAAAIMIGLFWSVKARIATTLVVFFGVAVVLLSPPLSAALSEKLLLRDWSGQVRIETWKETAAMLFDRPLTGAGLAGYQTTFAPYHRADYIEIFLYPHTLVFNFWSETGAYGLASFVMTGITLFIMLFFVMRRYTNFFTRVTAVALFGSLATLLIHGLVDVPYFKNDLAIQFWFLAGCIVALHRHVQMKG